MAEEYCPKDCEHLDLCEERYPRCCATAHRVYLDTRLLELDWDWGVAVVRRHRCAKAGWYKAKEEGNEDRG